MTGFLFPLTPWFFFRELPLPNFFDADAEASESDDTSVSERVASSPSVGGEVIPGVVFGKRMQVRHGLWEQGEIADERRWGFSWGLS